MAKKMISEKEGRKMREGRAGKAKKKIMKRKGGKMREREPGRKGVGKE